MTINTMRSVFLGGLLLTALAGCSPSFVGVGARPYGYYGARPFINPYAYGYRPPVIIRPAPRYFYHQPQYGYRYRSPRSYGGGFGGRRGWR